MANDFRVIGAMSKAKGKQFENLIETSLMWYKARGEAFVDKTPEPFTPIKNIGNGQYVCVCKEKAQPDYKGVVNGKAVMFEAKFTATGKIEQSRVTDAQCLYMLKAELCGAKCYIIAGFYGGGIYVIPWAWWRDMKRFAGRVHIKDGDDCIAQYRVRNDAGRVAEILGGVIKDVRNE